MTARSDKAQELFEDILRIHSEIAKLQDEMIQAEQKYHQQLNDEQGLGKYNHPALMWKKHK